MYLRDPGAAPGATWGIKFDYIGSDALFTNLFSAGSNNWCNQSAGCPGGFAQLGNNGPPANSSVWFNGPYAATGYITVPVDGLIPFQFVADVFDQHGNGTHVVANGTQGGVDTAHMGIFNISGGAFNFGGFDSQGTAWAVGLTDGGFTITDDDHQDFMIRITVASEPGTLPVLAFGLLALAAAARRRAA